MLVIYQGDVEMFNTKGSENTILLTKANLSKNREIKELRLLNKELLESLKIKCSLHPNQCPKDCLCKYCKPHKLLMRLK